jgi:hypothetical protein
MDDSNYNKYIEKLLNDNFEASELLQHELTKGLVREKFIREQINNQFGGNVNCVSGVLTVQKVKERIEYKQCDLVIFNHIVRRREIGTEYLIDPKDALLIADVKSSLRAQDLREWDVIAGKIQKRAKKEEWINPVQVGLICYRYRSESYRTFLRNFGFMYDNETDSYVYRNSAKQIKNLDYLFVLHNTEDDKRLLIRRNIKIPRQRNFVPYTMFTGQHASDNFWSFIASLNRIAVTRGSGSI